MIRPTPRAVLLFGATVPVAIGLMIHDQALWPIALDLGLFRSHVPFRTSVKFAHSGHASPT